MHYWLRVFLRMFENKWPAPLIAIVRWPGEAGMRFEARPPIRLIAIAGLAWAGCRPGERRPRPHVEPTAGEIYAHRVTLLLVAAVRRRRLRDVAGANPQRRQYPSLRRSRFNRPGKSRQLLRRDGFLSARLDRPHSRAVDHDDHGDRCLVPDDQVVGGLGWR